MEGTGTRLRDGVLAHLEKLEDYAHNLAMQQEEQKAQRRALVEMRARIQKLKNQRDELRLKVKLRSVGNLPQFPQENAKSIPSDPRKIAENRRQERLEMKVANLKAMLQAFHFTGISGKMTKRGVCMCITTAYECNYLDSYYMDLILRQPVRISHHSVPLFIPLKEIAEKYLTKDVKRFLFVLFDHLNAYAGRKYQADKLQNNASAFLSGTLQRNSLCNVLSFKYEVKWEDQSFRFSAKLVYGDSTRCLPTEAIVTCQADLPEPLQETISSHSALFRQKALHEVFESFNEGETLNSTGISVAE